MPDGGAGVRQRPAPSTISGASSTVSPLRRATASRSGIRSWIHSNASGTASSRWRARARSMSAAVGSAPPGTGRA
jgi:hypothetical protein